MLLQRKPLHRPKHGGDSLGNSHTLRPPYATDGSAVHAIFSVMPCTYSKTYNLASPSDTPASPPANNPRQKESYVPPTATLQSTEPHAPIPWEKPPHCPYPHVPAHAPADKTNCNNWALAVSDYKTTLAPRRCEPLPPQHCTRCSARRWRSRNLWLQNPAYFPFYLMATSIARVILQHVHAILQCQLLQGAFSYLISIPENTHEPEIYNVRVWLERIILRLSSTPPKVDSAVTFTSKSFGA